MVGIEILSGVRSHMNSVKIKFIPSTEYINTQDMPSPSSSNLPSWFKSAAPHIYNQENYYDIVKVNKDMLVNGGEWSSTFKHCLPFVDAMTSGYMLTLPSDILVINNNGVPYLKWNTSDTLVDSQPIEVLANTFPVPENCYEITFRWTSEWKVETPNGYSAMYTHPLNRLDLPFYTLSGVVDTDKHPNSIFIPFFLKKGFEGIIEAGTPIVQIIPFKRDPWVSEKGPVDKLSKFSSNFVKKHITNTYRKLYWSKKTYR